MRKTVVWLCFVSGLAMGADPALYPEGYAPVDVSYSAVSAGTGLETGMRMTPSAVQALEARYRTWSESDGTALDARPWNGLILLVK